MIWLNFVNRGAHRKASGNVEQDINAPMPRSETAYDVRDPLSVNQIQCFKRHFPVQLLDARAELSTISIQEEDRCAPLYKPITQFVSERSRGTSNHDPL
jgi:hypothetical protein